MACISVLRTISAFQPWFAPSGPAADGEFSDDFKIGLQRSPPDCLEIAMTSAPPQSCSAPDTSSTLAHHARSVSGPYPPVLKRVSGITLVCPRRGRAV
jgi:hypothetical protein